MFHQVICDLKPSDVLKWLIGTEEGREYYRNEVTKWYNSMAKDMERQLFGTEEEPIKITSDKFGVPLRTDEAGTFTKEECIRRGFDPDICPWLLKPELREDKDNET